MSRVFILFLAWLCVVSCSGTGAPEGAREVSATAPSAAATSSWVGSSTCGSCHVEDYQQWQSSHHGLAERALEPHLDRGLVDGKLPDGHAPVRAIGVDPLVQYVIETRPGQYQAHSLSWDIHQKQWFEAAPSDRVDGDWGHWTGRGLNWNSMCGSCHMTDFNEGYQALSDTYESSWVEPGVGCESCHGPGSVHAADPKASLRPPDMDTCASCHARRVSLTEGFEPGEAFLDHYLPRYPDLSGDWFANGQAQEEVFEWAGYSGSKMHQSGMTCTGCHEPHTGRPLADDDALCQRCHEGLPKPGPGHSHHSEKVACVDCHMPERVYMNRHPRRDHAMTIPDPLLADQIEAPDACAQCHADVPKDALQAAWVKWYGEDHQVRRSLPLALHAAREGTLDSPHPLLAHRGHPAPVWRATATRSLGPWATLPEVEQALKDASEDPDALVRLAAAQALDNGSGAPGDSHQAILTSLLNDTTRAVRVVAGAALRNAYPSHSDALRDYRAALELDMDQPTGQHAIGTWAFDSGRSREALPHLAQAVQWDANSPAFRHSYAVALDASGAPGKAREQLEVAIQLAPEDAALWHALGLARAATHPEQALEALDQAGKLAPSWGQPPKNRGLLLHALGRSDEALQSLKEASARAPNETEYHYALATVLRDLGATKESLQAVEQVLALDPKHEAGLQLKVFLGGPHAPP